MPSLIRLLQDWTPWPRPAPELVQWTQHLTCLRLGALAGGHRHAETGCPDRPGIRFEQPVHRIIGGGVPTE